MPVRPALPLALPLGYIAARPVRAAVNAAAAAVDAAAVVALSLCIWLRHLQRCCYMAEAAQLPQMLLDKPQLLRLASRPIAAGPCRS